MLDTEIGQLAGSLEHDGKLLLEYSVKYPIVAVSGKLSRGMEKINSFNKRLAENCEKYARGKLFLKLVGDYSKSGGKSGRRKTVYECAVTLEEQGDRLVSSVTARLLCGGKRQAFSIRSVFWDSRRGAPESITGEKAETISSHGEEKILKKIQY